MAGLDMLPVRHTDRFHDSGLDRLDQLAAFVGHDLALRRGNDVDPAEDGPQHGEQGKRHQQPGNDARRRGDRRFLQFERRRQELRLMRQALRRIEFATQFPNVTEDGGVALEQIQRGLQAQGEGLAHDGSP